MSATQGQFDDNIREMYGVQGYHAYGLDKLLAAVAKQVQMCGLYHALPCSVGSHAACCEHGSAAFAVCHSPVTEMPNATRTSPQLCHIVTDETSKSLSFLHTREKLPKGESPTSFWEALYRARARDKLMIEGEYLIRLVFVCDPIQWFCLVPSCRGVLSIGHLGTSHG
jgi:hypothetical protein